MIDNRQVIVFLNETLRPCCTEMAKCLTRIQAIRSQMAALDLMTLIPDTDEVIDDGSAEAGQPTISGQDVNAIVKLFDDLLAMAAGGNSKVRNLVRVGRNVLP
jgi:hypothetical protein